MGLSIAKAALNEIILHAKDGYPLEVCGVIAGFENEALKVFRMSNIDQSGEHYTMEPKEQFEVARKMRETGLSMLGAYHSHPASPARPSKEDIKLAYTPGISYVIVSLMDPTRPEVKSFKIEDGIALMEEIRLIQEGERWERKD